MQPAPDDSDVVDLAEIFPNEETSPAANSVIEQTYEESLAEDINFNNEDAFLEDSELEDDESLLEDIESDNQKDIIEESDLDNDDSPIDDLELEDDDLYIDEIIVDDEDSSVEEPELDEDDLSIDEIIVDESIIEIDGQAIGDFEIEASGQAEQITPDLTKMDIEKELAALEDLETETVDRISEKPSIPESDFELEEIELVEELEEVTEIDSLEAVEPIESFNDIDENEKSFDNDDNFPDEKALSWHPDYDLLGKNIESLTTGIDLPSGIFSLAVNSFNLTSGILLTYEPDSKIFTPFSSLSIDETSLRRCLISLDTLKEWDLVYSGTSIHTEISKDFLKPFLSKRVWDIIENLDVLIFNHHDRLFGLLLMFNNTINDNKQYYDFVSFFTRKCSELFHNSRSEKINSLPATPLEPPIDIDDAFETALRKIESFEISSDSSLKFIIINYYDIIEELLSRNDLIDKYRIESDIFKMYNSMLFGSSFILRISNDRLLIVFISGLASNNKIIKNQMTASLMSLFEKNSIVKPPLVFVEEIKADEADFKNEIRSFITDNL